jgi:hypothetical protein
MRRTRKLITAATITTITMEVVTDGVVITAGIMVDTEETMEVQAVVMEVVVVVAAAVVLSG